MGGSRVTNRRKEKLCRDLVAEPERKVPLGRMECRRVIGNVCISNGF